MRRKIVYAVTAAAVLAMVAGFALATITLNTQAQDGSGMYVNTGSVTGLTYSGTVLSATPSSSLSAPSGTGAIPQALTASTVSTLCVGPTATPTCTMGDFAEVTTYSDSTFTGSFMITMTVSASANAGSTTVYLKGATGASVVLDWDLGSSGGTTITSVTLTDQACTGTGGTCP